MTDDTATRLPRRRYRTTILVDADDHADFVQRLNRLANDLDFRLAEQGGGRPPHEYLGGDTGIVTTEERDEWLAGDEYTDALIDWHHRRRQAR